MIKKLLLYLAAIALLLTGCVDSESGSTCMRKNLQGGGSLGKLRHVVLFKFKEETPPEQIQALENAFRALPQGIDEVFNLEWGTDVSVENLSQGFTHCFLLTFENEENRDKYISHPIHKAFVSMLEQHLEKALVIDYMARK
jgi:Stress responsive A/B Barrel Domain